MAEKKAQRKTAESFFTPPGVSIYPKLVKPDTKYKPEGEYSTKLACSISNPEAKAIIDRVDAMLEKSLEIMKKEVAGKVDKRTKKPIEAFACPDLPYLIDEETGKVTFSFKMKASGEFEGKAYTRQPILVDSNRTRIDPEGLNIGGGSELIVSFTMATWFTEKLGAGVQLRLQGAQILKLVKYEKDLGFKKHEGGYVATPAAASDPNDDDDQGVTDPDEVDQTADEGEAKDPSDF